MRVGQVNAQTPFRSPSSSECELDDWRPRLLDGAQPRHPLGRVQAVGEAAEERVARCRHWSVVAGAAEQICKDALDVFFKFHIAKTFFLITIYGGISAALALFLKD